MGLDMFLEAERYIGYSNQEEKYSKDILDVLHDVNQDLLASHTGSADPVRVSQVVLSVAYWRKANAVHNWFVQNVQKGVDDCGRYPVSQLELVSLLDTCSQVIADPKLANTLLPSSQGFLFGGTEYDSWYFEQLKRTQQMIEHALVITQSPHWIFYYHASW